MLSTFFYLVARKRIVDIDTACIVKCGDVRKVYPN